MNTKTASLEKAQAAPEGRYAFADLLLPLVMLHASGSGNIHQLLNGLKKQACLVEELPLDADIPTILRSKRPILLVLGECDVLNLAKIQKIQEVCRTVSCGLFLLYDPGDKTALDRMASLMPDDCCPFEPTELILFRVKLALEAARTQSRFRLLKRAVEHAENGVIICDAISDDQPIIYVNPCFERITGYSAQEALGRNCRFLQRGEQDQPDLERLRSAFDKGESCTVLLKNFRKDHTPFWNRLHISPVYDEERRLTHFVGVQSDITAEVNALAELKESEERFRVMADSAAVMMWIMNRAQEWHFFNRSWLDLLGLNEGAPWLDRVRPLEQLRLRELLEAGLRQPRPFRWEGEIQFADKQYHLIVLSGVPRYDASGEFTGFVGSILDITEKKSYEHAVARRQRNLEAQGLIQRKLLTGGSDGNADLEVLNILAELTDGTSVSIWKLDEVEHVSGQIACVETSTARREKHSVRLNRQASQLWPRLRVGETLCLHLNDLKGSERDFFAERQSAFILMAPIFSRGHLRSVLVLESKLESYRLDAMNSELVQAAVASFTTVQTQADFEQERSRLAAFPKLSPNPFAILTQNHCFFENLAAQEFVQKLKLQSVKELLPEHFSKLVQYCLETGRTHQVVTTIGQDVRLNWTFVPLRNEKIVLAYGADISHLVALEQRLVHSQKMEALGELTSSIGFEFNNLLSAIQGSVDLIAMQSTLPASIMEQVSKISWESERGAVLARQLFLYGKVGGIERRPLDLTEVVSNMAEILDRILGSGMTRSLNLECGLPLMQGDRAMIEQAIYNLVLNAREASKGVGNVTISLCLVGPEEVPVQTGTTSPQGYLRLSVSDCGVGMTKEESTRIFEPLYSTKNSKEHSGLGLFVVYSIVIEHEGWIELSSVPNVGTTFLLFFPTLALSEAIPKVPSYALGTILLVEDNVAVAKNTSRLLTNYGHTVHLAHTGEEALSFWETHQAEIDVVLCDVVIDAVYNGPDLAKKFKAQKPSLKIVLTSGYSREFAVQTFDLSPDSLFIAKPFTISELTEIIQEAMPE